MHPVSLFNGLDPTNRRAAAIAVACLLLGSCASEPSATRPDGEQVVRVERSVVPVDPCWPDGPALSIWGLSPDLTWDDAGGDGVIDGMRIGSSLYVRGEMIDPSELAETWISACIHR